MTNDIERRLNEHYNNRGDQNSFAGKYYCFKLIYFERYQNVEDAISREKEIKKWSRKKKEAFIEKDNPNWNFINKQVWEY